MSHRKVRVRDDKHKMPMVKALLFISQSAYTLGAFRLLVV